MTSAAPASSKALTEHAAHTRAPHLRRVVTCAALAACVAFGVLGATGCSSTDIDVYVATSETTTAADGTLVEQVAYTLDEHANAVETTVTDADGTATATMAYDVYGAPAGAAEQGDVEFDDKGQPVRFVTRDEAGGVVATTTCTYSDVKGRLATAARTPGTAATPEENYGYELRFDRDGWPLDGTLTVDGAVHDLQFVYEVTDTGAVTLQIAEVDGAEVARYTYEYDENMKVSVRHNPDGSATAFAYELASDPSPAAMVEALAHEPDCAALAALVR